jgi:hypothetical protein
MEAEMNTTLVERRVSLAHDPAYVDSDYISHALQHGLVLQGRAGTLSAVEYLKAHEVPGSVIGRVLSGGSMRAKDWGAEH